MDVILDDKELEKLYTTGQSRKLKLPEQVIEKFFATIQKIESAISIHDLRADKGLRLEKLRGTKNRYSMRLSEKYRLEAEIIWIDDKQTIAKFYLKTISNHYGD
ncbi:MAG: type II toxin-antitoxin system RelE/ParE family toxin [Bacteroidia bacterium]|nr:type II toxin-antitoxin system RelE/ParE family toxin [Bacteroidia bacterium]